MAGAGEKVQDHHILKWAMGSSRASLGLALGHSLAVRVCSARSAARASLGLPLLPCPTETDPGKGRWRPINRQSTEASSSLGFGNFAPLPAKCSAQLGRFLPH